VPSGYDEQLVLEAKREILIELSLAISQADTGLGNAIAEPKDVLRLKRIFPVVKSVRREVKEFVVGIVLGRNLGANESPGSNQIG
jgi:hypothetical protein